jgi:hypothetical protein
MTLLWREWRTSSEHPSVTSDVCFLIPQSRASYLSSLGLLQFRSNLGLGTVFLEMFTLQEVCCACIQESTKWIPNGSALLNVPMLEHLSR